MYALPASRPYLGPPYPPRSLAPLIFFLILRCTRFLLPQAFLNTGGISGCFPWPPLFFVGGLIFLTLTLSGACRRTVFFATPFSVFPVLSAEKVSRTPGPPPRFACGEQTVFFFRTYRPSIPPTSRGSCLSSEFSAVPASG